MKAWAGIKKPTPEAFFQNLLPYAADGFMRQAMVLCWMMMPRSGGRDVKDVRKFITAIYQRNLDAWAADNRLFSGERKRPAKATAKAKPAKSKRAPAKKRRARK
jgi:hypothetical protein